MTARARRRWTTLRLGFRKIAPHAVERGGLPDENPRALGQFNGLCHSLGAPRTMVTHLLLIRFCPRTPSTSSPKVTWAAAAAAAVSSKSKSDRRKVGELTGYRPDGSLKKQTKIDGGKSNDRRHCHARTTAAAASAERIRGWHKGRLQVGPPKKPNSARGSGVEWSRLSPAESICKADPYGRLRFYARDIL